MSRRIALAGLLILMVLIAAVGSGQRRTYAVVALSNLPGNDLGATDLGTTVLKSWGFTTNTNAATLNSVSIRLRNLSGTSQSATITIRADNGGQPGTVLATLPEINVPNNSLATTYTRTPSSTINLSPGTTYWLVVGGTSATLEWTRNEPSIAPSGTIGYAYAGSWFSTNSGSSWAASTSINSGAIDVTLIPPTATFTPSATNTPTNTPTATPTPTLTPTATFTPSPIPPTPTFTATPPATPTMQLPTGVVNTLFPTYRWTSVSGATQYVLTVYDLTNPTVPLFLEPFSPSVCSGGVCTAVAGTALTNFRNYAAFVAAGIGGSFGSFSAGIAFQVGVPPATAPTLIAPDGVVNPGDFNPTYSWNSVQFADGYLLVVYDLAAPTTAQIVLQVPSTFCTGSVCTIKPVGAGTSLRNGSSYAFFVAGYNIFNAGPFSAGKIFQLNAPPVPPTLLQPGGTITNTTPIYTFSRVDNAPVYLVLTYNSSGTLVFQAVINATTNCNATQCTVQQTPALIPGAYGWYVASINSVASSAFSPVALFNIVSAVSAPTFEP